MHARASRRLARQRRLAAARAEAAERAAGTIAKERSADPELAFVESGQRQRLSYYDALPEPVRKAIAECPWDIHIERHLPSFMDCTDLIKAIRSITSERDAVAFNEAHARRGSVRLW